MRFDVLAHNRSAWDRQVERKNRWTVPADHEAIERARQGQPSILLTPTKTVPDSWFPKLQGADVLCLASGGGQQGPILAAAGARVTVLDNSPRQLAQDRLVGERESLAIDTILGDMANLAALEDESFDLIVHPVSNTFVPLLTPVWEEAHRVLRPGGLLLAGFTNPAVYLFDWEIVDRTGELEVRYPLPYADVEHLDAEGLEQYKAEGQPLEFSHTLTSQIGGQLAAGFVITALYEDGSDDPEEDVLSKYMDMYIATRAVKAFATPV